MLLGTALRRPEELQSAFEKISFTNAAPWAAGNLPILLFFVSQICITPEWSAWKLPGKNVSALSEAFLRISEGRQRVRRAFDKAV
jgi:hypothetical protein